MVRLNVECLEAREVMSAGVVAPVAADLTAPLGSTKGLFCGDGWWLGAAPAPGTPGGTRTGTVNGICAVWHD